MKIFHIRFAALFAALAAAGMVGAASAPAAETAKTAHATDLYADSQSDAATLASLPQGASVEVLQRRGAWTQVKAGGQTGWVRMLNLRFDTQSGAASSNGGGNPLAALASLGRKSNSGTETNAVRGINEEDLKNAQPNPAAFQQMTALASDKATAQRFGSKYKLASRQVPYLADSNNAQR
ncbi:MAG TPA: SH3 domain-containing protein [Burkholderiaceae bacterium]